MAGRWFGRKRGPWGDAPSIFRHVSRHIRGSGPGLKEGGERLPDEAAEPELSVPVAGGHDGLLIHHLGVQENEALARDIYHALTRTLADSTGIAQTRLYELINEGEALEYVDRVLELVLEHRELDADALLQLARWWAREAPDRQAVKFAIALLGLFNEEDDLEMLMKLGRHEEFTLFVAVAISNSRDDAGNLLWQLARNVEGWGRIHAVELLAEHPTPAVRSWMIREGYRNTILYDYLVGVCARAGDLVGALRAPEVDPELIDGAAEIVEAMLRVSGDELDRYDEAPEVVGLLLSHLSQAQPNLKHLICVYSIYSELNNDEADWQNRRRQGWTEEMRGEHLSACERILFQDHWKELACTALASPSETDFPTAVAACELLGIDTYAHHLARLLDAPSNPERWECCLERATARRLRALLVVAERHLLAGAVDPASREVCLESLLRELRDLPGRGTRLLQTVLHEPSPDLRGAALSVLDAWGFENWPRALATAVSELRARETVAEIIVGVDRMLEGGSFYETELWESDEV